MRRGGGGLVTALRGLIAHHDVTWIASAMSDEDRVVAREHGDEPIEESAQRRDLLAAPRRARPARLRPLLQRGLERRRSGSSSTTSGASRRRPTSSRRSGSPGATATSASTARSPTRCSTELDRNPDAEVFIHDYHLYLAPGYVREARPDARLLQFIHIPWAQADYWHVLPEDVRRAVHEGLLANDVVGFHTDRWRRNFVESCTRSPAPSGIRSASASSTTAAARTSSRGRSGSTRTSSRR